MRGAILRKIGIFTMLIVALLLGAACRSSGQDRYDNVCPSLQNASPPDLLQFLSAVIPDEKNAWCVTWAIHKLVPERYQLAIPIFAKLLDFHRPETQEEKNGVYLRPPSIDDLFPAAEALEEIGKNALPEVLRVIESDTSSETARINAVFLWMEIYRTAFRYELPKTVALLKQEEMKAKDSAVKQRLRWAVSKSLTWCSLPPENAPCKEAAKTGQF